MSLIPGSGNWGEANLRRAIIRWRLPTTKSLTKGGFSLSLGRICEILWRSEGRGLWRKHQSPAAVPSERCLFAWARNKQHL